MLSVTLGLLGWYLAVCEVFADKSEWGYQIHDEMVEVIDQLAGVQVNSSAYISCRDGGWVEYGEYVYPADPTISDKDQFCRDKCVEQAGSEYPLNSAFLKIGASNGGSQPGEDLLDCAFPVMIPEVSGSFLVNYLPGNVSVDAGDKKNASQLFRDFGIEVLLEPSFSEEDFVGAHHIGLVFQQYFNEYMSEALLDISPASFMVLPTACEGADYTMHTNVVRIGKLTNYNVKVMEQFNVQPDPVPTPLPQMVASAMPGHDVAPVSGSGSGSVSVSMPRRLGASIRHLIASMIPQFVTESIPNPSVPDGVTHGYRHMSLAWRDPVVVPSWQVGNITVISVKPLLVDILTHATTEMGYMLTSECPLAIRNPALPANQTLTPNDFGLIVARAASHVYGFDQECGSAKDCKDCLTKSDRYGRACHWCDIRTWTYDEEDAYLRLNWTDVARLDDWGDRCGASLDICHILGGTPDQCGVVYGMPDYQPISVDT